MFTETIHNCQNLEATKMSFSRKWTTCVHTDNGILFRAKKK